MGRERGISTGFSLSNPGHLDNPRLASEAGFKLNWDHVIECDDSRDYEFSVPFSQPL